MIKRTRKELDVLRPYVPGKPIEAVMEEYGLDRIVKLASNENPLGPSPKAVEAIQREASLVHLYPDPSARLLKREIAKAYDLQEEQIFLGNGGEEILKLLAETYLEEGDSIIMPDPGFSLYEISATLMGARTKKIPLNEDMSYDLEGMLGAIDQKTKLLYLCNPNNPTGTIFSRQALEDFLPQVPERVLVVLDEAYFDYAKIHPEYPDGTQYLKDYQNLIVLRTFSKVAGIAGVRIGFTLSSKELVEELSKVKASFNVNRLAQAAALGALEDPEHIEASVKLNQASLSLIQKDFQKRGYFVVEPGGNFLWAKTPFSSKDLFERLQAKGVIIRPGFLWGFDEWIRISSGTIEETNIFLETFDEIIGEIKL